MAVNKKDIKKLIKSCCPVNYNVYYPWVITLLENDTLIDIENYSNKQLISYIGGAKFAKNNFYIWYLFVHSDFQRQGIGKMMLEMMISKIEQAGYKKIFIDVNKQNKHVVNLALNAGFICTKGARVCSENGVIVEQYKLIIKP